MAPIRRYLRLTAHTTLEVRIYLDDPSQSPWLLHPSPPPTTAPSAVLPRIISSIRPLVLPKLREENERLRGKKAKKAKGTKDTVSGEDFEVAIYLMEREGAGAGCRHSVLKRERVSRQGLRGKGGVKRREGALKGWLTGTEGEPVDVDGDGDEAVVTVREESDEEDGGKGMSVLDYPELGRDGNEEDTHRKKKQRGNEGSIADETIDISDDEGFSSSQHRRTQGDDGALKTQDDTAKEAQMDKKKLGLQTRYDGFSIHGHILCLIVKRRGGGGVKGKMLEAHADGGGQQMMENWVSTQAAREDVVVED